MHKIKDILGIIPARGGSKGVPKKNIRLLGGHPLIAYTIKAALKSCIGRVIVSTDDPEIAAVSRIYGAEVPFFRPAHLAEDTSLSLSVLLHALTYIESCKNYFPNIIVFLQPTSPFRTFYHINKAIECLFSSDVDSVIGVCEVDKHPYIMFEKESDEKLVEYVRVRPKPLRRQDFPRLYVVNASMFISKRSYFYDLADTEPIFNWADLKGFVMDRVSSIDIDTEFDFQIAEAALPGLAQYNQEVLDISYDESLINIEPNQQQVNKHQGIYLS